MKRLMLGVTAVLALLLLLTLGAPLASADTITPYTLSNSNLGPSFTGPFGTVVVDLNTAGTMATITFTAGSGYVFLDGGIGDVNINGTWTLGTVTGITCATAGCDGGSGNIDGFGTFNQTINSKAGFGSAVTSFSFTITETGSTDWATSGVLFANSSGGDVAAHIAPTSLGGACTGYASDGTTSSTTPPAGCGGSVPDGGVTLMLLGGALVGLESLRRKFRV